MMNSKSNFVFSAKIFIFSLLLWLNFSETTAQKTAIKDFYDDFIRKTPEVFSEDVSTEGTKWKVFIHDSSNGYMKFALTDIEDGEVGMTNPAYEMAVWRKNDGSIVIGIFQSYCGGEGCFGTLDKLRFYDAKWNDISDKVFNFQAYLESTKKCKFKAGREDYKPDVSFFLRENLTCMVKIPQKGLDLTFHIFVPGIAEGCTDSYKFDKNSGTFSLNF